MGGGGVGGLAHESHSAKHPLLDGVLVVNHIHEGGLCGLHTATGSKHGPYTVTARPPCRGLPVPDNKALLGLCRMCNTLTLGTGDGSVAVLLHQQNPCHEHCYQQLNVHALKGNAFHNPVRPILDTGLMRIRTMLIRIIIAICLHTAGAISTIP